MEYPIFDVEVTRPVPSLPVGSASGMAVLVRWKRIPIAFWIEEDLAGPTLETDALARRIEEHAGPRVLAEAIREDLEETLDRPPPPSLTLAVCTRDRAEMLERCLVSLRDLDPAPWGSAGEVSVLVVDNAPSDTRTRNLVAAWPQVRYVHEPRPGLNFARNRALRESHTELLAFLDDDVLVDEVWPSGLYRAWRDNPDAAAFTGLVLPSELATTAQVLFEKRGGFRKGFERIRYGPTMPGVLLYPCGAGIFGTGANMVFRREVLLALGGFDEALDTGPRVPGGGDLDIFSRVVRSGHTLVYEPQLLVHHEHRRELAALRKQYARSFGLGHMAYVVKSFKDDSASRSRWVLFIIWWFLHEFRQLQKSLLGQHALGPGMLLAELWGGVVGLCGGYGRSRRSVQRIRSRFS